MTEISSLHGTFQGENAKTESVFKGKAREISPPELASGP